MDDAFHNFLGFLGALFIAIAIILVIAFVFARINPAPIVKGTMFELGDKIYQCKEVRPGL